MFVLSTLVFAADPPLGSYPIDEVCSREQTRELVQDWKWKKNSSNEREFCMRFTCRGANEAREVERCLRNMGPQNVIGILTQQSIHSPDSYRSVGNYEKLVLDPRDQCFDACRPREEGSGLFGKEQRFGVEREACRVCVIRHKPASGLRSFREPTSGRELIRGTSCYRACAPQEGDYAATVPQEQQSRCEACVAGLDAPKRFRYLLNQSGHCFEYDSSEQATVGHIVESVACQRDDVLTTVFEKKSGGFFESFFAGVRAGECLEVDESTQGKVYKRSVSMDFCLSAAVSDSDRTAPGKAGAAATGPTRPAPGATGR